MHPSSQESVRNPLSESFCTPCIVNGLVHLSPIVDRPLHAPVISRSNHVGIFKLEGCFGVAENGKFQLPSRIQDRARSVVRALPGKISFTISSRLSLYILISFLHRLLSKCLSISMCSWELFQRAENTDSGNVLEPADFKGKSEYVFSLNFVFFNISCPLKRAAFINAMMRIRPGIIWGRETVRGLGCEHSHQMRLCIGCFLPILPTHDGACSTNDRLSSVEFYRRMMILPQWLSRLPIQKWYIWQTFAIFSFPVGDTLYVT